MKKQRIYVAGHRGMVGSAIVRQLSQRDDVELVLRTRHELDLLDTQAVNAFFDSEAIDQVYLAAAKVQGTLEPTNEPYAIAKIAGIKLCESFNRQYGRDYRSVMPTNLYGPNDNFHPSNSHVIPALMRRFHEAAVNNTPKVVVWGSGRPMREFLHVDDMAAASIHVMELDKEVWEENTEPMLSHINVGTGKDCTIRELAHTVAQVSGYRGRVVFDETKPDGTPRKLLDVTRLHKLSWRHQISLEQGLTSTYKWFVENQHQYRG